jgi:hypothetical protein
MQDITTFFTHHSVYQLPDRTQVVAVWITFVDQPRWWFVEQLPDGRLSNLVATVMPNGSVWNYSLEPDASNPELCVPYPSDLTIEDFTPIEPDDRRNNNRTHAGKLLTTVWCLLSIDDAWRTIIDSAAVWQAI